MRGFVQTRSCLLIAVLALPLAAGCSMGWTQGWKLDAATPLKGTPDVEALRLAARAADGAAVDLKGVESLVRAWKDVLRAVPEDYEALWNLSSAYTLMGAGYSRSVGEKGEMYRKALQSAERAMALDEGFRKEIDAGAETWDAITVLPAARADAVGWWATAMMRMYNECLSGVVQETRKVWIDRDRKVLAHLQTLAPSWNGSLATYDTAVTAAVMPKRAGGDLAKAAALFDEAIAASPEFLRNRWGRARYLATAKGDLDGFRADLEWVVGRDLKASPGQNGWNVLIQRQAADLLAHPSNGF
jgi:hypothetical protein